MHKYFNGKELRPAEEGPKATQRRRGGCVHDLGKNV
jgi:hypothetical protein